MTHSEGGVPRLQRWLSINSFTSAALERSVAMATGRTISRQSMAKIRHGADVRLSTMRLIKCGAETLARRPVAIEELFDFDVLQYG